jgi:hypothetical protein
MPSSVARGDDYFFRSARNGQTLYEARAKSPLGRYIDTDSRAITGGDEEHPPP